jgi:uncharacterized protein YdeI (YjbR/CyaY-like superfamily)
VARAEGGGVMVEIGKQLHFANRDEWRAWLAEHHATEKEIWLVIYKKHADQPGIAYEDAVEEALCFGWIDGIVKGIDDKKYTLRFSPRKRDSVWSESNKRRVARLIKQGRMTKVGLAKVREAKKSGEWSKATRREDPTNIPADLAKALRANKQAQQNFARLAPSHKKQFIWWITDAKTDETRQRRILKTVRLVAQNKKPIDATRAETATRTDHAPARVRHSRRNRAASKDD